MVNEILRFALALALAPFVTSIVTLPFLFSQTFVRLFISDPYEFSKKTGKQYIIRITLALTPLILFWGVGVSGATILASEATQQLSQNLLGWFVLTTVLYIMLVVTQPTALREKLNIETGFYPTERKHTIILVGVTVVQTLTLFFAFAVLFYLF